LATPQYRLVTIIPERLFAVRSRVDLEMQGAVTKSGPNSCKYNSFE